MGGPVDEWGFRWAELRKRDRLSWYYFFGLIALLLAAHALGLPEFVAVLLSAPILAWMVAANWRKGDFLCPRCGKEFFRKRLFGFFGRADSSLRRCIHCGLEKFTPSHKV
jgi:predicted RNA-binding Zn-ribbon protein involved in translation (DUF1610 family)